MKNSGSAWSGWPAAAQRPIVQAAIRHGRVTASTECLALNSSRQIVATPSNEAAMKLPFMRARSANPGINANTATVVGTGSFTPRLAVAQSSMAGTGREKASASVIGTSGKASTAKAAASGRQSASHPEAAESARILAPHRMRPRSAGS